ncbi:hypothetical protein J1N35_044220 [Gossypium stocksii]|uniref:Retrotransposon gag domain-containing protein n=1 Tax=Gossypium stocksii TaxID=47602 RepID=A0A9D3ZFS5_9ROSI|nr:hypothetical protein J1N35_044220 [Gossypium stocksii]
MHSSAKMLIVLLNPLLLNTRNRIGLPLLHSILMMMSWSGLIGCIEINNFPDGFTLQWLLSSVFDLVNWTHQKDSFAKLQQTSTVQDYRPRFEAITNHTMFLPPLFLVQCFITGLRSDIKMAVLIHRPTELEDAIGLAYLHEQRLVLEKGFVRPSLGAGEPLLSTPKLHPLTQASSSLSSSTQNLAKLSSGANVPFQRLSPGRAQGICYHCNEKYTWDNKCKSKPQLLLFDEDKQYSPVLESSPDSTVAENL